jgi:hypothetical protein
VKATLQERNVAALDGAVRALEERGDRPEREPRECGTDPGDPADYDADRHAEEREQPAADRDRRGDEPPGAAPQLASGPEAAKSGESEDVARTEDAACPAEPSHAPAGALAWTELREGREAGRNDEERHHQRDEQGEHHRQRQIPEDLTRHARLLDEDDRKKDADRRERRRGDRAGDVLDALNRGLQRSKALRTPPGRGLEYDDRVVDQHADAEREAAERHDVERDAGQEHGREGRDDADSDHRGRDEGDQPAA